MMPHRNCAEVVINYVYSQSHCRDMVPHRSEIAVVINYVYTASVIVEVWCPIEVMLKL